VTLPDSGTRTVYPSGAIKEAPSVEKGRYDLIPPGALHRLAVHYARGAEKYPPGRTWEAGLPWSVLIGAALRHAFQWLAGARDEDHLAAVAWQIFALMDGEQRHPECCDVPSRKLPAVAGDVAAKKPGGVLLVDGIPVGEVSDVKFGPAWKPSEPIDGDCMAGTVSGVKAYAAGEKPAWCTKPVVGTAPTFGSALSATRQDHDKWSTPSPEPSRELGQKPDDEESTPERIACACGCGRSSEPGATNIAGRLYAAGHEPFFLRTSDPRTFVVGSMVRGVGKLSWADGDGKPLIENEPALCKYCAKNGVPCCPEHQKP
jgi:hypothetical protein